MAYKRRVQQKTKVSEGLVNIGLYITVLTDVKELWNKGQWKKTKI